MESLLLSAAKIIAAVAIGLPLLAYLAQDRLIFFPQRLDEASRAAIASRFPQAEELFIQSADGVRLHAWRTRPAGVARAPLVIYFGGNAEEVSWMLGEIGNAGPGAGWLLVDYRGYGASEGSPSERALVADALDWYDHAVKLEAVDASRIAAFGRSLGSGVAVQLAAQRPVCAVVLVAPFDSLVAVGRRHYPYLPVGWLLRHHFDSLALAPALSAPLLAVVAERDEIIPPEHADRLVAAWGGPTRRTLIAYATHNTIDQSPEYWRAISGFLAEFVR
jgi:pimeloyl-ACP methyl ester carboxylesterase